MSDEASAVTPKSPEEGGDPASRSEDALYIKKTIERGKLIRRALIKIGLRTNQIYKQKGITK